MNAPQSMQGWSFDARTVPIQNAFGQTPVPEGWYKVIVRKSNVKPTRDGTQNMLELQCEIIEGQYTGRAVFWNFNLFHTTSAQAVEIAYKQLAAVCAVTGAFNLSMQPGQDNAVPMLHNIPFYLMVVMAQGTQGPINNVKGVKDINGNEPGQQGSAPGPQTPAPAVAPAGPAAWGAPAPAPSSLGAPGGYTPPAGAPAPGPAPAPAWGPAPTGAPAPGPAQAPGWGAPAPAAAPGPAPAWGAPAPGPAPGPAPAGAPAWTPPTPGAAPGWGR